MITSLTWTSDATATIVAASKSLVHFRGGATRRWLELIHPEDLPLVAGWSERDLTLTPPIRLLGPDDGAVTFHLEATRIEPSDRPLWVVQARRVEPGLATRLKTSERITQTGSWELDVRTGTAWWSDELFRIFGLPPSADAPSYEQQQPMFSPASWESLDRESRRAATDGRGFELELELIDATGTAKIAVARSEVTFDDTGAISHLFGTFQDITDRKRIEDELRQTSERLELATSSANIGVWELAASSGALAWDATMRTLHGVDHVPDLAGWLASIPGDEARLLAQAIARTAPGDTFDVLHRVTLASGVRWLRTIAAVRRDAPRRLVGVTRDKTAETEAVVALRRSEALQRAVLSSASASVIATEKTGTIILFNQGAEALLGHAADAVVGTTTPLEFHVASEVEARRAVLEQELGVPVEPGFDVFVVKARMLRVADTNEWTYVHKDGTTRPVVLTVTGIYDDLDQLIGYLGLAFDLGPRKAAEAALHETNLQLDARSRQAEMLLQEVHHRVKNNLQVIASLVNMQIRQVQDPGGREALVECRQRIMAIALVHDQLYRSDTPTDVSFAEYASALLATISQVSGASAVAVQTVIAIAPTDIPLETMIPLGLVLNELATNAFKHAFVDRPTGTLRVGLEQTPHGLVFSVEDDGRGLPPGLADDLARPGSLGMRLVTSLVFQLDARLEVTSEPDRGTRFQITLPVP